MIQIVSGNPFLRKEISLMLSNLGFDCEVFPNDREALHNGTRNETSTYIADQNLRNIDNAGFIHLLWNKSEFPNCTTILLTDVKISAEEANALDAVIVKPPNLDDLLDQIKEVVCRLVNS